MKIFTFPITRLLSFFISVSFIFSGVPVDVHRAGPGAESCLAPWTMASPAGAAVTGTMPGPEATAAIGGLQTFMNSTDGFKGIFRATGPNLCFSVTQPGALDVVLPCIGSDMILAGLARWGLPVGSEYVFSRDSKGVSLYVRIENTCVRLRQGTEAELISGDEFNAIARKARAAARNDRITVGFDNIRQRKDGCIGVDIEIAGNDGQKKLEIRLPLPIVGILPGSNVEEVLSAIVKSVVLSFLANDRVLDEKDTSDIMFAVINELKKSPESLIRVKEVVTVPSLEDAQTRETIVAFASNVQSEGTRFLYNPLTGLWTPLSPRRYRKASSRPEMSVSQTEGGLKVAFGRNESLSFTLPIAGLSPTRVKQILLDIYKDESLVVNNTASMMRYFYYVVARLDRKYVSRVFPLFDDTATFRYRSSADGRDYIVNNAGVVSATDENTTLVPEVKSIGHWVSIIRNLRRVDFSSLKEELKEMLRDLLDKIPFIHNKSAAAMDQNASRNERKLALPKGKKAAPLVLGLLVIAILFSACAQTPVVDTTATPTDEPTPTDVTETTEPGQTPTTEPGQTPTTEPGQNVETVMVDLSVEPTDNTELLVEGDEEGVIYVNFPEGRPSEFAAQNNRTDMLTYVWYFNGTQSESVESVVIEFDLLETSEPLDPVTFGYERGFYIGMHNFDTIPVMPPWVSPEDYEDLLGFGQSRGGDTDRKVFLGYPELAVDMQKYVERDGDHVKIVIPYSEFQTASKNLTLQFLPGTTFGNLTSQLSCVEGVDMDAITSTAESVETDVVNDELAQFFEENGFDMPEFDTDTPQSLYDGVGQEVIDQGLVINPDGSISMPVSLYEDVLGEYAGEVQGDYAVVPEGLVSVFLTLTMNDFTNEQRRQVIDFTLNMIDENGQIAGVYDIEQGKMVATDRKVSALPILSAMLLHMDYGILTDAEIDQIMNSIINNQIVRVGDKLYYAPSGLSEDGVMNINLSDMAISDQLIRLLNEYSVDSNGRLDEKYGCAIFLEGFANSMELMLEAQEQNPTRLPSTQVKVTFHEDSSYELESSETFSINNSYFAMWNSRYQQFDLYVEEFAGADIPSMEALMKSISADADGNYSESQQEKIREAVAMYSERYDAYRILNTYYKSCLDVYNFVKTQPSSTVYAPGYNVNTGDIIDGASVELASDFEYMRSFRAHFGSPSTSMNWLNLVGMFNDEARVKETAYLTMINYGLHVGWLYSYPDATDPDIFAENSFNVWGYDSLKYILTSSVTGSNSTYFFYNRDSASFVREDGVQFTLRKLNENRPEEQALTLDYALPLFYDHIPSAVFETSDNQSLEIIDETSQNVESSVAVVDDENEGSTHATTAAVIANPVIANENGFQNVIGNLPVYGPLGILGAALLGVVLAVVYSGAKKKKSSFVMRTAGPRSPENAEDIIGRDLENLDHAVHGQNTKHWDIYAAPLLAGHNVQAPELSGMLATGNPANKAARPFLQKLRKDLSLFASIKTGLEIVDLDSIASAA